MCVSSVKGASFALMAWCKSESFSSYISLAFVDKIHCLGNHPPRPILYDQNVLLENFIPRVESRFHEVACYLLCMIGGLIYIIESSHWPVQ